MSSDSGSETGSELEVSGDSSLDTDTESISGDHEGQADAVEGHAQAPQELWEPPPKRQKLYLKNKRLAGHYNTKYIDLLNQDIISAASPFTNLPASKLHGSALGGSQWSSKEKNIFFEALAHFGRDDLPRIANAIGTKSPLEVRRYLLLLKDGLLEQSLNAEESRLLSWVDVPAAVEISQPLEKRLDLAAEALGAKLWQQESRQAKERHGELWCIGWDTAVEMERLFSDGKRGRKRARSETDAGPESPTTRLEADDGDVAVALRQDDELRQTAELFHSKTWVQLQHSIFMNAGGRRANENWLSIATDEEEPSMMRTAFTDFRRLANIVTRRLVHASQFQAMTRERAMRRGEDTDRPDEVERVDVIAALKSLNMPLPKHDFWAYTARRCGVKVVNDTKDSNIPILLSYDDAESELLGQPVMEEEHADDTSDFELLTVPDVQQEDEDEKLEAYAEALDKHWSGTEEQKLLAILGKQKVDAQEAPLPQRPRIKRKTQSDLLDWRDWTDYRAEWE